MFTDEPQDVSPEIETQEEGTESVEVIEESEEAPNWEEVAKEKEAEAKKWQAIAKRNEKKADRVSTQETGTLSIQDTLYLAKADIAAEDVADVLSYASKMGVSVQEAHQFYKPILNERSEERRTAQATATRSVRGTSKVSGEDLLRKAERTGELPTTDEGLASLFEARRNRQFKNYKK